jgi:hypothetical protein
MNPSPVFNPYKRHRFAAEIISHSVWLLCFPKSGHASQPTSSSDCLTLKDDFVVIEKHREIYDRWEWRPDHDMGPRWSEVVEP